MSKQRNRGERKRAGKKRQKLLKILKTKEMFKERERGERNEICKSMVSIVGICGK